MKKKEEEQSAKLIRCGMGLVLGGVEIPWDCGLLGHSDADVLTHAVMDLSLIHISEPTRH